MRFKEFDYSHIPGPGKYSIKGFAEKAQEKAMKYNSIVNNPSSIIVYKKKENNSKSKEVKDPNNDNDG
jgi:hypothetical protein